MAAGVQAVTRGSCLRLILVFVGIYSAYKGWLYHQYGEAPWLEIGGMTLFFVLWSAFLTNRRFIASGIRKAYPHNAPEDLRTLWEIDAANLRYSSKTSNGSFEWAAMFRVIRVPEGFLLQPQSALMHWLPLSGFESAAEADRFGALAREKARLYIDKSRSFFPFVWP